MTGRRLAPAMLWIFAACSTSGIEPPDPDLSGMEPRVIALLAGAREAVASAPRSHAAWGELGTVYDAHGLLAEAELCYRRAVELDPTVFDWAYFLAIVREHRGAEADEVIRLFGRAETIGSPEARAIPVRLGDALSLRGDHAGAEAQFRKAVDLLPQSAVAHRGLAQSLLAQGRAEDAARFFARAITLEPRDLAAYTGLAQALMRQGQQQRAQQILERSRGLEPVNAFADPLYNRKIFERSVSSSRVYARALARIRDGDPAAAIADLDRVLEVRPDDASAHYWKGSAQRRLGQLDPAERHLARAVELEPTLARAHAELGLVLREQGREPEAQVHLQTAAELDPDYSP